MKRSLEIPLDDVLDAQKRLRAHLRRKFQREQLGTAVVLRTVLHVRAGGIVVEVPWEETSGGGSVCEIISPGR